MEVISQGIFRFDFQRSVKPEIALISRNSSFSAVLRSSYFDFDNYRILVNVTDRFLCNLLVDLITY